MNRYFLLALVPVFFLAAALLPAGDVNNAAAEQAVAAGNVSVNTPEALPDKIVLTKSEFENLGIVVNGNNIVAVMEYRYKINRRTSDDFAEKLQDQGYKSKSGIYRTNVYINPVSILPDETPLPCGKWSQTEGSTLLPLAVTAEFNRSAESNSKSSLSLMYVATDSPLLKEFSNDKIFRWDNKFTPRINKLLPVTLAYEGSGASKTEIRIHFWYLASKELVEKLPERYREGLRTELGIVDSVNNGKLPYDDGCNKVENNSYFDLCGVSSGALGGLTVFPHPVVTNARCRLLLKENRTITMQLFDGGGALVSTILSNSAQMKGTPEIDIPFDELSSGVYILVVVSDMNEKIAAKVIVSR